MDAWVQQSAEQIAARAARDLEALVAVSSPSGDRHGAEDCVAVVRALAPPAATVERIPCSSPGHADDVVVRLRGEGRGRLLLLGHLDTVVPHQRHASLRREDERLTGSGTIDMKAGDVLALGLLRALADATAERRADAGGRRASGAAAGVAAPSFAEVALLLVVDEEWRTGPMQHVERFAGWDGCLCFEAGELAPDGSDAVIVRRKAAGTLSVHARGVASHAGAAPDRGRNALLALAAAAQIVAAAHAPDGPDRLTAVPTTLHSGDAFNVVPDDGELICDLRSDRTEAFEEVRASIPRELGGVVLDAQLARVWPAMDSRAATAPLLAAASERLGRPLVAAGRGGASDASHVAPAVPFTVDGLGPRGGRAHAPGEFVLEASLRPRAEVALALAAAVLAAAD
ncbi:M20/M25/M40 family metallo-hydrolase [Conexibacter sp. CPCC 206217]|uniref:M20/M25/M40 family metallo-hydrolase n=1 Tax=Conexibacter sp. CPCC 206217 TaxID=3064574 RepID=UPI002722304F|nr:M20/M25/M40 family metallo-hydrolase [Conexibacter sp. CPCC 206217]MDO8211282.1 M20/M25/M40 family metallo-hydrolase [Conexibacter sp. CPCC 206217]